MKQRKDKGIPREDADRLRRYSLDISCSQCGAKEHIGIGEHELLYAFLVNHQKRGAKHEGRTVKPGWSFIGYSWDV